MGGQVYTGIHIDGAGGREFQEAVGFQGGTALVFCQGAHRRTQGNAGGLQDDGVRIPGGVVDFQGTARRDGQIPGRRQIAVHTNGIGGGNADFRCTGAAHEAAVDGAVQHQIPTGNVQLAGGNDAPAGMGEGQGAAGGAQHDTGHMAAADANGAIQIDAAGARHLDAAAGAAGNHGGRIRQDQAVIAGGKHTGTQGLAAEGRAGAAGEHHLIIGLDESGNGQGAAGGQAHVAAGAPGDHVALQHAIYARIEDDGTIHGFQYARGIQVDVFAVHRGAAVQVDGGIGPHLAGDVELAVGTTGLTDGNDGTSCGRIHRVSATGNLIGSAIGAEDEAQVAAIAGTGRQHREGIGADETDVAVLELGGQIRIDGIGEGIAGIQGMLGRHIAPGDVPALGLEGPVDVLQQIGNAGVGGGVAGVDGDRSLNGEAHQVQFQVQGHVPGELAIRRDRPGTGNQGIHVARRQDIHPARGIEIDLAVGPGGGDRGGAIQHQAAAFIRRANGFGPAVQAADEVHPLAGHDVGADDELPVRLHADGGIHIVVHDIAANVLAIGPHHFAPAARYEQAQHVHIAHAVEADIAGGAYAAVPVPRSFHHQFGGPVHHETLAVRVRATIYGDGTAGIQVAAGWDDLTGLVKGMPADIDALRAIDEDVRIPVGPGQGLGQHIAIGIEGLHQLAAAIDPAEDFHAAAAVDGDRAAGTAGPQACGGNAAGGIDEHRQQIARISNGRIAAPVVVRIRRAAGDGDVAAGQEAGFQAYLFPCSHKNARPAIALGVQGEADTGGTDCAAGNDSPHNVHILGALDGDRAVGRRGAHRAGGMHIDAGAVLVGPAERHAVHADTAIKRDALGGGAEAFRIQEGVRLQAQGGVRPGGIDVAALNHILGGTQHQVLAVPQAGNGASDQHAVAGAVIHQIVGRADRRDIGEVGRLVEDGVARLVSVRAGGVRRIRRIAVGRTVMEGRARRQTHGTGGRYGTAQQHFMGGIQVHRAVGARDERNGRTAGTEVHARTDGGTRIHRDHVGRSQVQADIAAQTPDIRAFDNDDRTAGINVQGGREAAQGDGASQLDALGRGDSDLAGSRRRHPGGESGTPHIPAVLGGNGRAAIHLKAVGAVRPVEIQIRGRRDGRCHVDGDGIRPIRPSGNLGLLAHIQHQVLGVETGIRGAVGVLHVMARDPQLAGLQGQGIQGIPHIPNDIDLIRQQGGVITEGGFPGICGPGIVREHLHLVGELGVPQPHHVAQGRAADEEAGEAVRQGRQIPSRQIHARMGQLLGAVFFVIEADGTFCCRTQVISGDVLLGLDVQAAGADEMAGAALEVQVVGDEADVLALLQGLHHAGHQGQHGVVAHQFDGQVAVGHFHRHAGMGHITRVLQQVEPGGGGRVVPGLQGFPVIGAGGAGDHVAGVFRANEGSGLHQIEVVGLLDIHVAAAAGAGAGAQGHTADAGQDRVDRGTDGVLGIDEDISVGADDRGVVVVLERAIGEGGLAAPVEQGAVRHLDAYPARTALIIGIGGRRSQDRGRIQVGAENDIGPVAIGGQIDVAIGQSRDVVRDGEGLDRLHDDTGGQDGAFLEHLVAQCPEGRATHVGSGDRKARGRGGHLAGGEADIAPQGSNLAGVVTRTLALEGQALHATGVVGDHFAAVGDSLVVELGGEVGTSLFQDDFVEAAAGVGNGQGAGGRGSRRIAQGDAVVIVATGVVDIDPPFGEARHQQGVIHLAQGQAGDMGAGNAHFLVLLVVQAQVFAGEVRREGRRHQSRIDQGVAFPIGHHVVAEMVLEEVAVVPCPALLLVVAGAAVQIVIAGAAIQQVIAGVAVEGIRRRTAIQLVIAVATLEGEAGDARRIHLAQLHLEGVVARIAPKGATTGAADHGVIAIAAMHIHGGVQQTGGIQGVLASPHVAHHLLDARIGLVPAVEFDVHRAAGAGQNEVLVRVRRIEVQAAACQGPRIEGKGTVARKGSQHRLDVRRLIGDVEQVDLEQGQIEEPDRGDPQVQVHEQGGDEVGADADVEQILEAAILVAPHGGDFGTAHLAVGFPGKGRDIAVGVMHQHLPADVLQVHIGVEIDGGGDATGDGAQVQGRGQANGGIDIELRLVHAAGAGNDLAVPEGRHGPVADVEAVEDVEPVAGGHGLAHAVGIVAEGQVRIGAEGQISQQLENKGRWRNGNGRQEEALVEAAAQEGQFVGKQGGVTTGEYLLPVVGGLDVFEKFEAAAGRFAAATLGGGHDLGHLVLQGLGDGLIAGRRAGDRARTEATEAADEDFAAVGGQLPRQVVHELHGIEEGLRNLRLAVDLQESIHHAQGCRLDTHHGQEAQPVDGRDHHVHEGLDGGDDVLDLVGDGQQDVIHHGADVHPHIVQGEGGRGHLLTIGPGPVAGHIGLELG